MSASSYVRVRRAQRSWTFAAMMAREIRVLRRNFLSTFIRVLLQPVLLIFVFGYVLPKVNAGGATSSGGTSFATVLLPGIVAEAMVTQGAMAVIVPLMMELSWQRSITERAMAPLSIPLIAVQKMVAGALQALIGGLLVFPAVFLIHPAGQGPQVHVSNWPMFVLVLLSCALLGSSGGLLLGTSIPPQHVQILATVLMLPMTMLGCVYYPWSALEEISWLQILVLANPLVYATEGMRAMLTPQVGNLPFVAIISVLVGGPVVLGWLAARKFTARVRV